MGLLNLTLGQFLAILIPLSGMLVALYFYDRSRRRLVVSTLRFWPRRPAPPKRTRHRKLRQPLSLLLQLLAVALLLLAIADLRWGDFARQPRHHVLILETSAWMNAADRAPGSADSAQAGAATLMQAARRSALAYLAAVPPDEPVMLVRADALPTPVTGFTTDRAELQEAVRQSAPGWTAVNLSGALELARSSLELVAGGGAAEPDGSPASASSPAVGEVAYVGTGRIAAAEQGRIRTGGIPFLRLIRVGEQVRDCGIQRLAARRDPDDPTRWQVVMGLQNYAARPRRLRVNLSFARKPLGGQAVELAPNGSREIAFRLRSEGGGLLEVALAPGDDFEGNNHAALELPALVRRPVEVYSARPEQWRTLLTAGPHVEPRLHRPAEYGVQPGAGLLRIFDRFVPPELPAGGAMFFDPPQGGSPVLITRRVRNARIVRWASDHPLARGLRDSDIRLARASVFELGPDDVAIAECEDGPVIVARSRQGERSVVFGFHPLEAGLEDRLAIPLLFANTLRWFIPEVFRATEVRAGSPGLVELELPGASEPEIEISSPENSDLPWSFAAQRLRFYVAGPGSVTVRTPFQQAELTVELPEVGTDLWEPPAGIRRGVPPPMKGRSLASFSFWPWLAVAALLILAADWRFFGRGLPATTVSPEPRPATSAPLQSLGLGGSPTANGPAAARQRQPAR